VRERVNPAGWGVAIFAPGVLLIGAPSFELYGPVVILGSSALSLGADVGSNNTGELCGIGEALLWLRDEAPKPPSTPAVIHYDSKYAANIANSTYKAHTNENLARQVQTLYKKVSSQRSLHLSHVKGHSGHHGNELADALANRGAVGEWSRVSHRWSSAFANGDSFFGAAPGAPPQKKRRLMDIDAVPAGTTETSVSATSSGKVDADKLKKLLVTFADEVEQADRKGQECSHDTFQRASPPQGALDLTGKESDLNLQNHTDSPSVANPKNSVETKLFFGPQRGKSLDELVRNHPEDAVWAIAKLQAFIVRRGLWRIFKSEAAVHQSDGDAASSRCVER